MALLIFFIMRTALPGFLGGALSFVSLILRENVGIGEIKKQKLLLENTLKHELKHQQI